MIKNELILYKLNNGCEKILCGPEKVHPVGMRERVVSFCHGQAERRKGDDPNTMGQTKQARGLASLGRAPDTGKSAVRNAQNQIIGVTRLRTVTK